jgi:hypothetical protein
VPIARNVQQTPPHNTRQLLWSFAALLILPVALDSAPRVRYSLAKALPVIPHTHVDVVSGAAAALAFTGELFMLKALLVMSMDHHHSHAHTAAAAGGGGAAAQGAAHPGALGKVRIWGGGAGARRSGWGAQGSQGS